MGVEVLEGWDAEVEGASRSEDWDDTQYEAGELGHAGDEASADQATLLANPSEGDGAADARDGRGSHQQTEHRAIEALCVGVACGDAVKAQHRHVKKGQWKAGEEDVLVVVGHPAGLEGAHGFSHLVATAALFGRVRLGNNGGFVHKWLRWLLGTLAILQICQRAE